MPCEHPNKYARGMCKNCYMRDYRKRNPSLFKKHEQLRRERHGDKIRAYDRERNKLPHRLERVRKYRQDNPERMREYERVRALNPERQAYCRRLREKHIERVRLLDRNRYKRDSDKRKELVSRRRGYKGKATPRWLTQEQKEQLRLIYKNRPEGHHVDHIVPLKGKSVCGLHVPWNLQYLPAQLNLKKGNKLGNA